MGRPKDVEVWPTVFVVKFSQSHPFPGWQVLRMLSVTVKTVILKFWSLKFDERENARVMLESEERMSRM